MSRRVTVNKCGNRKGIWLPKTVTESLNIQGNDQLEITIKNGDIVLSKSQQELTIEELFKDYDGGSFHSHLQYFDPVGDERW